MKYKKKIECISPSIAQDVKKVSDIYNISNSTLCLFNNTESRKRKESEEVDLFPPDDVGHVKSKKRWKKEDSNSSDSCDYLITNENQRRKGKGVLKE